jgi:uncharacterized integral membrane protein
MRFLILLLVVVLTIVLVGFLLTNDGNRVSEVVVWNTVYTDVPLYWLILPAVLAGVLVVGIIAVAEGANLRIANRRMRGEIQQLETEINYLRTQPPVGSGAGAGKDRASLPGAPTDESEDPPSLPSGPVYDADGGDDDDIYSGGRAV